MKNIVIFILGALISAVLGIVLSHLAIGWVGQTVTLWGCAALVFFDSVIGMRHTVIEGIIVTALFTEGKSAWVCRGVLWGQLVAAEPNKAKAGTFEP